MQSTKLTEKQDKKKKKQGVNVSRGGMDIRWWREPPTLLSLWPTIRLACPGLVAVCRVTVPSSLHGFRDSGLRVFISFVRALKAMSVTNGSFGVKRDGRKWLGVMRRGRVTLARACKSGGCSGLQDSTVVFEEPLTCAVSCCVRFYGVFARHPPGGAVRRSVHINLSALKGTEVISSWTYDVIITRGVTIGHEVRSESLSWGQKNGLGGPCVRPKVKAKMERRTSHLC